LNATYGEGFGLPIVEAGACGTPSIATAFSSMPDLIKDRGWLVTGELAYCQQALSNWQTVPSIEEIMETLREVYDRPDEVSRRGQAMRDWVRQNLGWDKIAGQWLRLLDSVAADVGVKFPFAA
ncbi:MAG: glycosyltransferase, partial [Chloroflexi bacterium]|nr:glycosyltransferase [Chloroflexota bacterium]